MCVRVKSREVLLEFFFHKEKIAMLEISECIAVEQHGNSNYLGIAHPSLSPMFLGMMCRAFMQKKRCFPVILTYIACENYYNTIYFCNFVSSIY